MNGRGQASVTLYLDESGTDEKSAATLFGAFYLRNLDYVAFSADWQREVLDKHNIPGLHMKEFGRGHTLRYLKKNGRCAALFEDVRRLINQYKLLTFSTPIQTADYNTCLGPLSYKGDGFSREYVSFILAIGVNSVLAPKMTLDGELIPIVMDDGSTAAAHMENALAWAKSNDLEFAKFAGPLSFEKDNLVFPLQAADVIAWSCRRKHAGGWFPKGFEPLEGLVNGHGHFDERFKDDWLEELSDTLRRGP